MITEISHKLISVGIFRAGPLERSFLTGGTSSYVWKLSDGHKSVVVKYPREFLDLPTPCPVSANRSGIEQDFLNYTSVLFPNNIPEILYGDRKNNWFCMPCFNDLSNWKEVMLNGHFSEQYARHTAILLRKLHSKSLGCSKALATFSCSDNFKSMRVEPYFITIALHYHQFSSRISLLIQRLLSNQKCLIHGDFSPKNILVGNKMVMIDGETAWYGDPVFDVAFMLNHLLLKAFLHPHKLDQLISLIKSFLDEYGAVEDERWLVELITWLMLARIDGKSPVEYLNDEQDNKVRSFVFEVIERKVCDLKNLLIQLQSHLLIK